MAIGNKCSHLINRWSHHEIAWRGLLQVWREHGTKRLSLLTWAQLTEKNVDASPIPGVLSCRRQLRVRGFRHRSAHATNDFRHVLRLPTARRSPRNQRSVTAIAKTILRAKRSTETLKFVRKCGIKRFIAFEPTYIVRPLKIAIITAEYLTFISNNSAWKTTCRIH